MLMPCEPSVQVEAEIFDVFRLGDLHIVEKDRWAGSTSRCEGDMDRLGSVGFQWSHICVDVSVGNGPLSLYCPCVTMNAMTTI
jgi:hypothetical protein